MERLKFEVMTIVLQVPRPHEMPHSCPPKEEVEQKLEAIYFHLEDLSCAHAVIIFNKPSAHSYSFFLFQIEQNGRFRGSAIFSSDRKWYACRCFKKQNAKLASVFWPSFWLLTLVSKCKVLSTDIFLRGQS